MRLSSAVLMFWCFSTSGKSATVAVREYFSNRGELSPNMLCCFHLQGKEKYKFPNPNPFVEDDMDKNEVASVAYR